MDALNYDGEDEKEALQNGISNINGVVDASVDDATAPYDVANTVEENVCIFSKITGF